MMFTKVIKAMQIYSLYICSFAILMFWFTQQSFSEKLEDAFLDISSEYQYYDELELLYDRGMIFPDSEWKFSANKFLNRDEFVWISLEVSCNRCISPDTQVEYIKKYSWTNTFYDVPSSSKYFYCIAESDNKNYVKWYDIWYQCDSWKRSENQRPFCVDNKITLEEALAVLLRNSWIFTVEDNKKVMDDIYNGNISQKLSIDVLPRNSDGSVYTFYWYFQKALELELVEYDTSGNQKIYRLLDQDAVRFNPKKSISKEDFLKMAYIILKSNSCKKSDAYYTLPVSLSILNKQCVSTDSNCVNKNINPTDRQFDFSWSWAWICEKWIDSDTWYVWKYYHPWSWTEYIKYGPYIDNYWLEPSWKWEVYLYIEDNCGNSWRAVSSLYIESDNDILDYNWWDLSARIIWWPLTWKEWILHDFTWVPLWGSWEYTYSWKYGDGETWTGKNTKHTYKQPWKYTLELQIRDSEWEISTATSTVVVTNSGPNNDVENDLWVKIIWGPLFQSVWENVDFEWVAVWWDGNYTYRWNVWNGNNSETKRNQYSYNKPWVYVVEVEVTDWNWNTSTAQVTVVITDNNDSDSWENSWNNTNWEDDNSNNTTDWLWVSLQADPLRQNVGEDINFSSVVSGWNWDYTYDIDYWDGTSWTESASTHSFEKTWTYTVTLKVEDSDGRKWTSILNVKVIDPNDNGNKNSWLWVVIQATPLTIFEWESVSFDSIITSWTWIYTYSWDYWDWGTWETKSAEYIYNTPGIYYVILNVRDSEGNTWRAKTTIVVKEKTSDLNDDTNSETDNWLWVRLEWWPSTQYVWEDVWFTWIVSGGDGNYTYSWDYWDAWIGSEKDITHRYSTPGTYIIELIAADWTNRTGRAEAQINVIERDDDSDWQNSNENNTNWLWVQITWQSAIDLWEPSRLTWIATGWDGNYTYTWDYGDWVIGTGEKISHIYKQIGTYQVSLIVTDWEWREGNAQVDVPVSDNGKWWGFTVVMSWKPPLGSAKLRVDFETQITPEWEYNYEWNFWDGNTGVWPKPVHIFETKWIYVTDLIVTNSDWKTATAQQLIRVYESDSCELDRDADGIMDCRDACPLISGNILNGWCPILDPFCDSNCACPEGYVCSSTDPNICWTEGVCEPYIESINPCLEKWYGAFIYWNTTCNSCPCVHSIDFNSVLRKCDVIFPAITSVDSKTIFSRGDVYTISQ